MACLHIRNCVVVLFVLLVHQEYKDRNHSDQDNAVYRKEAQAGLPTSTVRVALTINTYILCRATLARGTDALAIAMLGTERLATAIVPATDKGSADVIGRLSTLVAVTLDAHTSNDHWSCSRLDLVLHINVDNCTASWGSNLLLLHHRLLLHHLLLHARLHHGLLLHAWLHHLLHARLHHRLLHARLHHHRLLLHTRLHHLLLHAWLHHWLLHTWHHWLHTWLVHHHLLWHRLLDHAWLLSELNALRRGDYWHAH